MLFLSGLWSKENIKAFNENYDHIWKICKDYMILSKQSPNTVSLKHIKLSLDLFTLYKVDDQTHTSDFLIQIQKKAKQCGSIITLDELQELLENSNFFINLNRQLEANGSIIWKL